MTICPSPGLPPSYGMMLWKRTRATKALIFLEEKPKRLSKLQGESQRLINQPVMKAAFLMGRRQKANFVAQRARPTTLQPLPAPAGIFMSRDDTAVKERKSDVVTMKCYSSVGYYSLLCLVQCDNTSKAMDRIHKLTSFC